MRFRLEFVDGTTCYGEADDFDDASVRPVGAENFICACYAAHSY
jgi:hypothetical protein